MRSPGLQNRMRELWEKVRIASTGLEDTAFAYWVEGTVTIVAEPSIVPDLQAKSGQIAEQLRARHSGGQLIDSVEILPGDAGSRAALRVAHEALRLADDAFSAGDGS